MKGEVRELEKRLLQAANAAERLEALFELGGHHAAALDNREGLRTAREALDIARTSGDRAGMGRALTLASLCHLQRADYFAAVASGVDALAALGPQPSPARSDALQNIALAFLRIEEHPLAETIAERALAAAQEDLATLARAHGVLGLVYSERGRQHAARREFRLAGAAYRQLGDPQGLKQSATAIGNTYRNQGSAAAAAGRDDEARLQWRHAIRVYRIALAAGDGAAADGLIAASIAECECRLGEIDAAYGRASEALGRGEASGSAAVIALSRLWESRALRAMGRIEAAEHACARAIAAAEKVEDDALLAACLAARAELQDRLGRFETGADLEQRALRMGHQRAARFARIRAELAPLWERHCADEAGIVRLNSRA